MIAFSAFRAAIALMLATSCGRNDRRNVADPDSNTRKRVVVSQRVPSTMSRDGWTECAPEGDRSRHQDELDAVVGFAISNLVAIESDVVTVQRFVPKSSDDVMSVGFLDGASGELENGDVAIGVDIRTTTGSLVIVRGGGPSRHFCMDIRRGSGTEIVLDQYGETIGD